MKKKSIVLALLLGMILLSSCAEDTPQMNSEVPAKAQQELLARYPQARDVQWDVVKGYHVARFNAPAGRAAQYNTNVWFTEEGNFCQTDEDIEFKNLPAAVQDAFNKYKAGMYADWDIDDCEILEREGMSLIYLIEIEKADQEREISVSAQGDILKDVLDDDDEDEVLPVIIPDEINTALQKIFPDTYQNLAILELEIDDDEIEIDVMEDGRHKEIELDSQYNIVAIEYEISVAEAQAMMSDELFQQILAMAKKAGFDLFDKELQDNIEIEVRQTANGCTFDIEIELNDVEMEVEIDEEGNIKIK